MPTPKHPLLVNGICRLGRVCYWIGVTVAVVILLGGGLFSISEAGRHQNIMMNLAGMILFWGVIAAAPFSIGRGLRYVLSGE